MELPKERLPRSMVLVVYFLKSVSKALLPFTCPKQSPKMSGN